MTVEHQLIMGVEDMRGMQGETERLIREVSERIDQASQTSRTKNGAAHYDARTN